MRPTLKFALAAVASALLLTACQLKRPAPRQPRPVEPVTVPRPPIATQNYFRTAASVDLFVVRASRRALERARDARRREAARVLLADHEGTAAQLSFAGRRLNLLPSAAMLPVHQAMFEELAASGNFDATWRRQMLQMHELAVKLHGDYAARGASPTLRPVAASAVRIERRHLDRLRAR